MAFYNEYRPKQFSSVVGQDKVVDILKRQAMIGQYSHSYLFFGSSGTGKTTTARILASSMNCLNGHKEGEPCGECQNCRTIQECRNWDVREIDGANLRGIDDIRNLISHSYLYPMTGSKKVYIIDEAHSLTPEAFNCLLKLLEEPPPYLVIILVTTNFERIPETIVSRCQLYPFAKLKAEYIKSKLKAIVKSEGMDIDDKGLEFVAQCSGGNCRIAENQLEQQCVLAR